MNKCVILFERHFYYSLFTKNNIMKFKLTFTFLFVGIFMLNNNFAQSNTPIYKKVEIKINDDADIAKIGGLGIDLQCGIHLEERGGQRFLRLDLSEFEYNSLQQTDLTTTVLIEDLTRYHVTRNVAELPEAIAALEQAKVTSRLKSADNEACEDRTFPVPENFNMGSMGGFTTYQELLDDLDKMAQMYPNLITTKAPISDTLVTYEGRTINYVKVSDNPNTDEEGNEAQVLYTGVHHAREPISMINLQYYLWVLLENYATNDYIKNLVDNTEMYFVPVLNPDGYIYNQTTDPNGGGFWRKNRRNNGDGTFGVDLNRNYGYEWGNNIGSSPNPGSGTYRGPSPFSEPETQAIRNFVERHNFVNAFNNHTYSNMLLSPWGFTNEIPQAELHDELGEEMCKHNRYIYGGGSSILYPTSGGSDDWYYGEKSILAWTPEIGTEGQGGFWPLPTLITTLCQGHLRTSLELAASATNYGTLRDLTPYKLSQEDNELTFSIQHLSNVPGNLMVSVSSNSPYVQNIASASMTTLTLSDADFGTVSTNVSLDTDTPDNTFIDFDVTLNNGIRDLQTITITKLYNAPVVFTDDCATLDNWQTDWGIDNTTGYRQNGCITDSPNGNMAFNKHNLVLSEIDLTDIDEPILEYYAKWDISRLFDYIQVQISADGGTVWNDLCTENTKPGVASVSSFLDGSSEQPSGDPLYDGLQKEWIREQIDLAEYANSPGVLLRFLAYGDDTEPHADGFYLDDITIYNGTGMVVANENPVADNTLIRVYPNPTNGDIFIDWQTPINNGELVIYDKMGQLVYTQNILQNTDNLNFNASQLPSGIYMIQLKSARNLAVKRFVKM